MIVVRIFYNALVLGLEIGAIVLVAAIGYKQPLAFAATTFVAAFALGMSLEYARVRYELPFYFGRAGPSLSVVARVTAFTEGGAKALLAGVVALLTFVGTDLDRLFWVAVIFGACIFAGSSLLRRLSISFDARVERWGYFRLAAPLGLLYSVPLSFLPAPSLSELGRRVIFDIPARPSLAQASELLFVLKQKFDEVVTGMLGLLLPPELAKAIGILVSVNMLTGFVLAVYALIIADVVRRLEEAGPRARR